MGTPVIVFTSRERTTNWQGDASLSSQEWMEFFSLISVEDYRAVREMICNGSVKVEQYPTFYDQLIEDVLSCLVNHHSSCLDEYLRGELEKHLHMMELFSELGIENSFCRICRASLYLYLNKIDEFNELLPQLSKPRGYREASDLLLLNKLCDDNDQELNEQFFKPVLSKVYQALEEYPSFPIDQVVNKI